MRAHPCRTLSAVARSWLFLSLMVGLSVAAVLYVAGCFNLKISAGRAASELRSESPAIRSVRCEDSSGGWDYVCSVRLRTGGIQRIYIKVDGHGITAQSNP